MVHIKEKRHQSFEQEWIQMFLGGGKMTLGDWESHFWNRMGKHNS